MVTAFWKSKLFNVATTHSDFTKRGIVGFLRSSPNYKNQYCSYISRAYFNGIFPEQYEESLVEIAKLKDDEKNSIVSCILDDNEKPGIKNESFKNSFIDVLLAYIHSIVQTRLARVPMKNPKAQEVFNEIMNSGRLPLFFFVQKVSLSSHPKRVLVSINVDYLLNSSLMLIVYFFYLIFVEMPGGIQIIEKNIRLHHGSNGSLLRILGAQQIFHRWKN